MREFELGLQLPSPLQELHDDRLADVRLFLKRDDLIHPEVTGNKWRKLKYLLADASAAGASTLLTFGGAYSNHLRALAAAGRICGFATIGVVRGEEEPYNAVLDAAVADGMRLHYMDRAPTGARPNRRPSMHSTAVSATSTWCLRAAARRSRSRAAGSSSTRSSSRST